MTASISIRPYTVLDEENTVKQSASPDGLASLYVELQPLANKIKVFARALLVVSLLRLASIEGLLGILSSLAVLCWAAPGSLGVAYASRQARMMAWLSASGAALGLIGALSFAVTMMPDINGYVYSACLKAKELELLHDGNIESVLMSEDTPAGTDACEAAATTTEKVLPSLLVLFSFVEVSLFILAVAVGKMANLLVLKARACGANAI